MAKIVIIGGGVSGLSAGIYARICGHEAVICEMGGCVGGNLTGWQRGEYHIDNCIHWLTGTNPATDIYKMWEDLGALGDVEVMQAESLYTYKRGDKRVSLFCDLERTRTHMLEISPCDEYEIDKLFEAVRAVQGHCGIAGDAHNEKHGAIKDVFSMLCLYRYYRMSTGELAKKFYSPLLRDFLTSFLGEDFGSIALVVVFAHFSGNNGGIPRGSSRGMAERMVERFKLLGGRLLLKSEVVRINTKDGKSVSVSLKNGEVEETDYVIVTIDPATVFGKLIDAPMPQGLASKYNDCNMQRFSALHCAFSCDLDSLPFESDIIFEIPEDKQISLGSKNLVLREFSHEPSFAPSGKNIIQSVIFCPEEICKEFIKLKADRAAYTQRKKEMAETIQGIIEKEFPELRGKLDVIDVWTPATYKRFIGSEIGSFMSFALPHKCLPIRTSNKIRGIDNVFLATQWQQIPGGLPIAAEGGRLAVKSIEELEKKRTSTSKHKVSGKVSHA